MNVLLFWNKTKRKFIRGFSSYICKITKQKKGICTCLVSCFISQPSGCAFVTKATRPQPAKPQGLCGGLCHLEWRLFFYFLKDVNFSSFWELSLKNGNFNITKCKYRRFQRSKHKTQNRKAWNSNNTFWMSWNIIKTPCMLEIL